MLASKNCLLLLKGIPNNNNPVNFTSKVWQTPIFSENSSQGKWITERKESKNTEKMRKGLPKYT